MADQEIAINDLAVIQQLNDILARGTDLHEGYELVASCRAPIAWFGFVTCAWSV